MNIVMIRYNIGLDRVTSLGSGSDYTAFMHYLGIPSVDIRYTYEEVTELELMLFTHFDVTD